jgi:hypothetical protein
MSSVVVAWLLVVPSLDPSGLTASANAQTSGPGTHFRRGVPDVNGTMAVNQLIPTALPWNVSFPVRPDVLAHTS